MGSSGRRVAEGTQGKLKMTRTLSKISLILLPLLCMGSPIEAKNWRYWPNIGCYEFSFERTVFFELTNEATRLSAITGSELPAIVNTSIVPASNNELQLQHILAGSIKNSTTNTPEECIISCNATGFAYAGLQDGKRCVCMNEPPTAKADDNCNTPCPGNANFSCGGTWTMDLHQNPAYHSTNLTYIGCFKNTFNDLDRMLFEGTYNNFRNNTPDWCVAYCTSGGFDYAGLQYGSQCICTNSGPQGTSDAGQCTYGCAGDSSVKMCGGLGYINIFHTDAHKTTIDDWGCGNTVQDTYYQKWYNDMGHCGVTSGGSKSIAPTTTTVAPTTTPETWATLATCPYSKPGQKLQCEAYYSRSSSLETIRTALKCSGVEVDKCAIPPAYGHGIQCCLGGGLGPLYMAAWKGNADIVELLLRDGRSDVNIQDRDYNRETPLARAAEFSKVDIVKLLLRCPKVDVTLKNKNGMTAMDWAVRNGNSEIINAINNRDELIKTEGKII